MANIDSRPTSTGELIAIVSVCSLILLMGLFCMFGGVMLLGQGKYVDGAVFLALGTMLSAGGGGGIVWGRRWVHSSRRFVAQMAAHPDEPWVWREDWRMRRVTGDSQFWAGFFIVFAIIWNGISVPMAAAVFVHGWPREQGVSFTVITCLVGGICLFWGAFYFGRRAVKFGRAWFLLDHLPYRLGRPVEGKIMVERGRHMNSPVTVVITNRHVRSVQDPHEPRKSNTKVDILWESAPVTVNPVEFSREGGAVIVPVRLTLTACGTPTCIESGTDHIDWVLKASSEVPGVNFGTEFDIPVF